MRPKLQKQVKTSLLVNKFGLEWVTLYIDSLLVFCSTVSPFILLLSSLPLLLLPSSPIPPFSLSPSYIPLAPFFYLSPFTDATVVVNCTKQDYDGFRHDKFFGEWSKDQVLELTVGDVITDVKLVCSSQWIMTTIHRAICCCSSKVALCIVECFT